MMQWVEYTGEITDVILDRVDGFFQRANRRQPGADEVVGIHVLGCQRGAHEGSAYDGLAGVRVQVEGGERPAMRDETHLSALWCKR